jgi:hypothetical protein
MGCFQTGGGDLATAERAAPLRAEHLGLSAELEPGGPQTAELDRRFAWYCSNPGHRSLPPAADDEGQLRTGHRTLPALPVRADEAGADLELEI